MDAVTGYYLTSSLALLVLAIGLLLIFLARTPQWVTAVLLIAAIVLATAAGVLAFQAAS